MRVEQLQEQLANARGGRVVLLSHCLLNQNVRYLGGAGRAGGVGELADGYLARGVGICQLPCPEQRAWGGVLKRRMLVAYGSAGTLRAPVARLLRPFTCYTKRGVRPARPGDHPGSAGLPPLRCGGGRPGGHRWFTAVRGWPPPWICPPPSPR
jgi:hypothetical protein